MSEKIYNLTEEEIEAITSRAVLKALKDIGLHDEGAVDDIKDLRGLLKTFREARYTAFKTIVKNFINFLFISLMIGIAAKTGLWLKD